MEETFPRKRLAVKQTTIPTREEETRLRPTRKRLALKQKESARDYTTQTFEEETFPRKRFAVREEEEEDDELDDSELQRRDSP